jgi:predicted deacylase
VFVTWVLDPAMHLTESKGVVSFMVEIGTIVREGQPLFQICDPVSDTLTTVCSPADGCMCGTCPLTLAPFVRFVLMWLAGTTGKG